MIASTTKRQPTPAARLRSAIARDRVNSHLAGMLDGLDLETRIEACRAGIRALAQITKGDAGEARATGVLCGALVDVSPAYRVEANFSEAEALFRAPEGEG